MVTPRGGQYQLILPDGSKVWLNAASSIRYPTAFTGNERKVEITGEVYFEIEKLRNVSGQKIPFKVVIAPSPLGESRGAIEVLGTHFNINAYDDEASSKVTLLEGMVKVMKEQGAKNANDKVILNPGEQAVLTVDHSPLSIEHSPDLEQVMSWKNGFTAFKSADIKSIMRQVARWYDVDVKFEGTISERTFTGGVSRSASLSELLRLLEVSKVHFKLNGKELIVTE
jgi:ferric-dicitrate binding protein FerR (iron transport regulator)